MLNDEKIKAGTEQVNFTDKQTSSQQFPCSVTPKDTLGIALPRQLNGYNEGRQRSEGHEERPEPTCTFWANHDSRARGLGSLSVPEQGAPAAIKVMGIPV